MRVTCSAGLAAMVFQAVPVRTSRSGLRILMTLFFARNPGLVAPNRRPNPLCEGIPLDNTNDVPPGTINPPPLNPGGVSPNHPDGVPPGPINLPPIHPGGVLPTHPGNVNPLPLNPGGALPTHPGGVNPPPLNPGGATLTHTGVVPSPVDVLLFNGVPVPQGLFAFIGANFPFGPPPVNPTPPSVPAGLSPSALQLEIELCCVGAVEADPYFSEYDLLVFPSPDIKARPYDRILLLSLARGFILPVINFVRHSEKRFSNICGINAFYVVTAVNYDGSVDVQRLTEHRFLPDGTPFPSPMWATFYPPIGDRTVLVLSAFVLESNRLPAAVKTALLASKIVASALHCRVEDTSATGGHSSFAGRASELRDIANAPIRRALHGDRAVFYRLVGPQGDITNQQFFTTLRNSQPSPALQALPFFSSSEHLGLFLSFSWGNSLVLSNKKPESCHLAFFLPFLSPTVFATFRNTHDIFLALVNLESACKAVFCESSDRPFFAHIFVPLQKRLTNADHADSLQSVPIDFLVWKISEILSRWAALFMDTGLARSPFAEFKAANMRVLDLVPLTLKQESLTSDHKLLPRQQGGRGATHQSPSPGKRADRKRRPQSSPPGQARNKLAGGGGGGGQPPKPSPPRPVPPPAAGVKPAKDKYICVADFFHKVDPVVNPQDCKKGAAACNQRHMPKPVPGKFAPKDRAEILLSITRMQNLPGAKRQEMIDFVNSIM